MCECVCASHMPTVCSCDRVGGVMCLLGSGLGSGQSLDSPRDQTLPLSRQQSEGQVSQETAARTTLRSINGENDFEDSCLSTSGSLLSWEQTLPVEAGGAGLTQNAFQKWTNPSEDSCGHIGDFIQHVLPAAWVTSPWQTNRLPTVVFDLHCTRGEGEDGHVCGWGCVG